MTAAVAAPLLTQQHPHSLENIPKSGTISEAVASHFTTKQTSPGSHLAACAIAGPCLCVDELH